MKAYLFSRLVTIPDFVLKPMNEFTLLKTVQKRSLE